MCRSADEGGRRCNGRSSGAAGARLRQQRSRARRSLEAAHAAGDPDQIATAEAKYTAATGTPPPAPAPGGRDKPQPTAPEKPMPKPEEPESGKPQPPTPATDPRSGAPEDRIRAAYRQLATRKNEFIRLTDVRKAIGNDLPQAEFNELLKTMTRTGLVHLSPDSDRRNLTQDDHDTAVHIGRVPNHFLCIEEDE